MIYSLLGTTRLWQDAIREMARHFPPSAGVLRLLVIGGSGQQFLKYRPDLELTCIENSEAAHLSMPDASFDAIIGIKLLHHPKSQVFLQEAWRVLRPGGRLIWLDPLNKECSRPSLLKHPQAAILFRLWSAGSGNEFPLDAVADQFSTAGFARVLTERLMNGCAMLSRGEKPYPVSATTHRIALTADQESSALTPVDATSLPERTHYLLLLVQQTPNKPAWAIQPGEAIRWQAAVIDYAAKPCLLAFTSLPKAVQFMQSVVTAGLLVGINKVAKFDKTIAPRWGVDLLLNPAFEAIQPGLSDNQWLEVDPGTAVAGEE